MRHKLQPRQNSSPFGGCGIPQVLVFFKKKKLKDLIKFDSIRVFLKKKMKNKQQ